MEGIKTRTQKFEKKGVPENNRIIQGSDKEVRKTPRPGLVSLNDLRHFVRHIPRIAKTIDSIKIRQATEKDLDQLLAVEQAAWPE